jgi:hypothetical protein
LVGGSSAPRLSWRPRTHSACRRRPPARPRHSTAGPIACAAAYIGVPPTALAADIGNEARRTGTIGTQVAIDQLDTALTRHLTTSDAAHPATAVSKWSSIALHDAIHDTLLHIAVTGLRGALGG